MRRAIFTLAPLFLFTAVGCSSGRASDGDIVRFCRLSSRCSGTSEAACEASTQGVRDEADRRGCASRLGAVLRCAVRADVCIETGECADENDALDACASGSTTDAGFTPVDAAIFLPDAGGPVIPSPLRQGAGGMIEIFHEGEWRPICDDGFSMEEATVACRQLGLSGALGYSTVTGPTDDFWLDDVTCNGTESSLDECSHGGWGYDNCTSGETQAVECF